MKTNRFVVSLGTALALFGTASADQIVVRRNEVVRIVMDDSISARNARVNDDFSAHVEDDRVLPRGTRLYGRVTRVMKASRGRPAAIELAFEELRLPDGNSERIYAVPMSLKSRGISRSRDGRLIDDDDGRKRTQTVAGGLLGGLAIGSILKKPFEGAFVGALAGILIAESDSNSSNGSIVRRGDRIGARFERDFRCDYRGSWSYGDSRYRDDDYRGRDDDSRYRRDDFGGTSCQFLYRGREIEYRDEVPYRAGEHWMLPLEDTARQLGFSCEVDERRGRIYLEDDDNFAVLELRSSSARVNGRQCELGRNIETRNRVIYVPSRVFEELRNGDFRIKELNARR